jgi:hypothetical protein
MKSYHFIFLILAAPIFQHELHAIDEYKDARMKDQNMQEVNTKDGKGLGLGRKNCFVVNKTRVRLCDKRAEDYCNQNKREKVCRRFFNADVSRP